MDDFRGESDCPGNRMNLKSSPPVISDDRWAALFSNDMIIPWPAHPAGPAAAQGSCWTYSAAAARH